MSGVYIKMEMPKSCYRCDFSDGLYCLVCNETMDKMTWIRRRPEWCPLIPVPDHGRLIDADALYRRIKTECNPYGKPTIGYDEGNKVMHVIIGTPTIIPADKEADNG